MPGKVWPAMRSCVAALFGATLPKLNPRKLGLCWELLGLDFMLDQAGQVYLIEVNTSPALFRAGTYLTDLLPRIVEGCVQLAIDPHFPAPASAAGLPDPQQIFERVELPQQTKLKPAASVSPSSSLKRRSSSNITKGVAAGDGRPSPGATTGTRLSPERLTRRTSSNSKAGAAVIVPVPAPTVRTAASKCMARHGGPTRTAALLAGKA